jgi:hypothetical protein
MSGSKKASIKSSTIPFMIPSVPCPRNILITKFEYISFRNKNILIKIIFKRLKIEKIDQLVFRPWLQSLNAE